jgi:hypothetical protein
MSGSRKVLIFGGLALAILGMSYGLAYAAFVEHQTLDGLGGSLTTAFVKGAERDLPAAQRSLEIYAHNAYVYVRQVDAHSHWIGLAMVLVVLGIAFDRVGFSDAWKLALALALLGGAVVFPLGVLMQTWMPGAVPRVVAAAGAASVTAAMAGTAWGFSRAH